MGSSSYYCVVGSPEPQDSNRRWFPRFFYLLTLNGGDREDNNNIIMNVFITKANASKIVKQLDLSKLEIEGDLYVRKSRVLNAMFSKYEKHALLAYKRLMEDPEDFMNEIYEKIPLREDTYWWVYEKNNPPAYHSCPECSRLLSNFKNYKIPAVIRFKGIHRNKNIETIHFKELNEAEKTKVISNVIDYRRWWNKEGEKYFLKDKDLFLMHVNNKYQPEPRIRDITKFDAENSGIEKIINCSLEEIENKIDQLIEESGRYYYKTSKNSTILRYYAKLAGNIINDNYFSKKTAYTDEEIKEVLVDYDKRIKDPIKRYLKEYYRIKNNPELKMEQNILEQLGFRACSACQNQSNEQNKKLNSLIGVSTPVLEDFLDGIDYWSDEFLELMLEADIENDRLYWEDLSRYENL